MGEKFLETPVARAVASSLVGGCWEDGKSFIPVSGVRRESVSHASQTVFYFVGQNVLWCGEDVWLRMCGLDDNNMPALLTFCYYYYY